MHTAALSNILGPIVLILSILHGSVMQCGVDHSNAEVFQHCLGAHVQDSGNMYGSFLPNRFLKI